MARANVADVADVAKARVAQPARDALATYLAVAYDPLSYAHPSWRDESIGRLATRAAPAANRLLAARAGLRASLDWMQSADPMVHYLVQHWQTIAPAAALLRQLAQRDTTLTRGGLLQPGAPRASVLALPLLAPALRSLREHARDADGPDADTAGAAIVMRAVSGLPEGLTERVRLIFPRPRGDAVRTDVRCEPSPAALAYVLRCAINHVETNRTA